MKSKPALLPILALIAALVVGILIGNFTKKDPPPSEEYTSLVQELRTAVAEISTLSEAMQQFKDRQTETQLILDDLNERTSSIQEDAKNYYYRTRQRLFELREKRDSLKREEGRILELIEKFNK